MSKRYVVSGATGMIGIAFIKKALINHCEVVAIIRNGSSQASLLPKDPRLEIVECDLQDYCNYKPIVKADVFIHLAWESTTVGGRDNVDCQYRNIGYALDAVRLAYAFGCSCFIGAGSQAEYGLQMHKLSEETPINPLSAYGIAKYSAGKLTYNLCNQLKIRHCWTRILSVYGENDGENSLISYLIRTLSSGEIPKLTHCEQVWDYMNCADTAYALLCIAGKGIHGRNYCLGSGEGRPLREWVIDLKDIVAPNVQLKFGENPYYPHQPMFLVADLAVLTAETGFVPQVKFRDGIKRLTVKEKK